MLTTAKKSRVDGQRSAAVDAALAESPPAHARGLTLVELLIVMVVIAVLAALLLPALRSARQSARTISCSSNLRSVCMRFTFFVEGHSEHGRGDSEALGGTAIWINDFQDSLYGLDEFWDAHPASSATISAGKSLVICPESGRSLRKYSGFPCSRSAIDPLDGVSLAVNMRLYRSAIEFKGKSLLAPANSTIVRSTVLHNPYVPLMMDVDARAALQQGVDPFYIAPPVAKRTDPYSSGRYWSPSTRHAGRTIAAFVGGHVLSSSNPEKEAWDWSYQADVKR